MAAKHVEFPDEPVTTVGETATRRAAETTQATTGTCIPHHIDLCWRF